MSRRSSGWIARLMVLSLAAAAGALAFGASAVTMTPAARSTAAAVHRRLLAQGRERLFEPRLAGAFVHRPFHPQPETPAQALVRWRVAARLDDLRRTLPAGSSHEAAAEGLSRLYQQDAAGAVALLRDAVHRDPGEPSYWCDLAGAALVRGQPTDLLEALDSAGTALQLDPSHEAAAFNRALALERLGLFRAAHDAWTDAARLATAAGWAAEAHDRARHVAPDEGPPLTGDAILRTAPRDRVALARAHLDRVRQLVEDDLMPRLGVVCSQGNGPACAALLADLRATALAGAEAAPGDRWWSAVAAQLEQWGTGDWEASGRVTALNEYSAGVQLFATDRVAQSAEVFRILLARQREPILTVHWNAAYYACVDAYFRGDHGAARTCLDAFDHEAARRGFTYLRGKAEWLRAQISLAEGNLARASGDFERAIARMRESGDVNQLAAIRSLRATLLDQLGAFDDAWRDRIGALIHARLEPRRRHTLLTSAARSALLQRFPRAALEFVTAAVANATSWGQPGALVEAHLTAATILHRLGRQDEARQHLELARRQFAGIADDRARGRFEGDVAVTEGEVLAASAPADALAALALASARLTSLQLDLLRVRAERAAGLALERLRRPADALAAFERGIAIVERQREHLGASQQVQSLDVTWDLYEKLIARRLADTGSDGAFVAAESARSQEIRGFLPADAGAVPSLSAVSALLPARTAIVYFVVLEDQTLRWTITRHGVDLTRMPIGRQAVDHLVQRLRRALERDPWDAPLRAASRELYGLAVPAAHPWTRGDTLVVIPDGALHELPFAVLRNPTTARFLVEDHPVVVAPNLRLFLSASRAAADRFRALDRVLVVEGRTGTGDGLTPLPPLPAAATEIAAVAQAYPRSRVLDAAQATPARFLAEAGDYRVVHFSGHAIADRPSPELSRLFLTPSPAEPTGWLLLRDIQSASFHQTGLVVLGACETGAGRIFRGEGVVSLARPFLGKGAAGVVYSLWNVSDTPSARLLTAFHHNVRRGLEPAVGLQQAQLELLRQMHTGEELRTWTAFQYAGGILGMGRH